MTRSRLPTYAAGFNRFATRGACHELVDSQCKAPAPFRFERQGVGHECETYAIRLEGPADS
jgi:hypothetical protein